MSIMLNSPESNITDRIFQFSPVGIAVISCDGRWIKTNPALRRILGCEKESELTNGNFMDVIYPNNAENRSDYLQHLAFGEETSIQIEAICRTKSERTLAIRLFLTKLPRTEADPERLIVYFTEISGSPRKRPSKQQLEENLQKYSSLKKYNPNGIFSIDPSGTISNHNPAAEKLLGYRHEELVGKKYLHLIHSSQRKLAKKRFKLLIQGNVLTDIHCWLKHKDGHFIEVLITPAPIIINHIISGLFLIFKDITETRRSEDAMLRAEKLSVAGQLAAGVAHEIRNPLTAIKGFLQLLKNANAEKSRTYLEIVQAELERIEIIISEMLVLAKPQKTDFRLMDMKRILEDVIALISAQAAMSNVGIKAAIPCQLPAILCDSNQMKQVFINILKNAIEAMPDGGEITLAVEASRKGQLVVRITDQGSGISEEQITRLGEPFYTTKGNGTGLGLMVSQKILKNHGAFLRISSQLQIGTTVEVIFPVKV